MQAVANLGAEARAIGDLSARWAVPKHQSHGTAQAQGGDVRPGEVKEEERAKPQA
jgi:hypothetical protein